MGGRSNQLRLLPFMLSIMACSWETTTTQALQCFASQSKIPVQLQCQGQGLKRALSCRHAQQPFGSKKKAVLRRSIGDDFSSPIPFPSSSPSRSFIRKPWKGLLKCALLGLMAWLAIPRVATAALAPSVEAASPIIASATAATETSLTPLMMDFGAPVSAAEELRLTLRLVYAALMGAALGKERSFAKHSAGVRTMALVAMGASAFTVCSIYGFLQFPGRYDPSRMAANVASGVGFVGAGVITTSAHRDSMNVVHGLTTAATIWLSAGVGVACGVGLFRVATTAALTTITILRLGRRKPKNQSKIGKVREESEKQQPNAKSSFLEQMRATSDGSNEEDFENEPSDYFAEVHDTSVWDEHHEDEHNEPFKDETYHDKQQNVAHFENTSEEVKDLLAQRTDQMSQIVEEAWRQNESSLPTEAMEFDSLEKYIKRPNSTHSRAEKEPKRNIPGSDIWGP